MNNELNSEYLAQLDSERYKDFCTAHGWSTLVSADPADILEFVEEMGEDADFGEFVSYIANRA